MFEQRVILIDESRVPAEERHDEIIVRKFPFRIGRASSGAATSSDIYPGTFNDVQIHETRQPYNVSRHHVEIGFAEDRLYIRDLGSAAGTIVNGRTIGGNRRSETILVDAPEVQLILGKSSSPWRFRIVITRQVRKPRLLIADDEEAIRKLMAQALEKFYDIVEAEDGRAALESCLSDPPDVAILDWLMPKIDGVKVCKALKSNLATARVPILMVTAKAETIDRITGIEAGADDYLPKPFEMEELCARVNAAVARSQRMRDTDWLTGLLSEEGFRRELDRFLAGGQNRPEYAVVLVILRGLATYQAENDPSHVDRLLRETAQHLWKKTIDLPRTVAGRAGLNCFMLAVPAREANAAARQLRRELTELLGDSVVRVRIEVHRLKRGFRNFLDFVERL